MDAGAARHRAGKGGSPLVMESATGVDTFIMVQPEPPGYRFQRAGACASCFFQRNVYNLISQMIPI